jgi:EAL domain-containing protein (putative c-di-GMP-specific phosphodiesterase class I)
MVPLVYLLVYATGGIKYVYSHTMYLPILMMGVFFGWKGGLLVAALGALLLGPFMPIDVTTGEQQETLNWVYRTIVFLFIGAFSGFFSDALRNSRQRVIHLLSKHPISNIKLYNALSKEQLNTVHEGCLSLIRVLNYQHIIDHLSSNTYYRLWEHIHNELQEQDELDGELYQMDNHAFLWVSNDHFESSFQQLMDILSISHTIDDVPIYLDVVIGYTGDAHPLIVKTQNAYLASRFAEDHHLSSLRYDVQQRKDDISFALVAEVRKAIQDQQFFLEYQPIIDAQTNRIAGMEALIRWQHPVHGLLPPLMFLPTIEQTQLIHDLTRFVCQTVAKDMMDLVVNEDLYLTVNLSTINLFNPRLIQEITTGIFTQSQRDHLIFEITESVLSNRPAATKEVLNKIKNTGIRLALDDFGTGYSSLSFLGEYPIDVIKIDKSFVQRFSNRSIKNIVASAIDLAHSLDYTVVAEGVETEYLAVQLTGMKSDYLQGFHFAKPMSKDAIRSTIMKQN